MCVCVREGCACVWCMCVRCECRFGAYYGLLLRSAEEETEKLKRDEQRKAALENTLRLEGVTPFAERYISEKLLRTP